MRRYKVASKTFEVQGETLYISNHVLQRLLERGVKRGFFSMGEVRGRSQTLISELLDRAELGFFTNGSSHGEGYLYEDWLFVRKGDAIVTTYIVDPDKVEFHPWDSEVFVPTVE